MSQNTQLFAPLKSTILTMAQGYSTKNMIFSKVACGSLKESKISYKRVKISTKNPDGSVGDLIIPTEELYSFGLQEQKDFVTKQPNGSYVFPLCLYNKEEPTDKQKEWVTVFEKIVKECKQYILQNKQELGLYDIDKSDLRKLSPLYWKKENGKVVDGLGPTLYAKLYVSKRGGNTKFVSAFYDDEGKDIDPMDIFEHHCLAKAAIKIESIFINAGKVSIQVKLYEAEVKPIQQSLKRLLPQPQVSTRLLSPSDNPLDDTVDDSEESDVELIVDSSD